jgi:hypothetical protein
VAVIGSFKQHYDAVLSAIAAFRNAGWTVTSPAGTAVREPGIDFVRFVTDDAGDTDALVQTRTLINIFSADLTYVVAPNGYVGRTTCYEIGRLVQAGKPIFLSQPPFDLPIFIPPDFVCTPDELINRVRVAGGTQWPFASGTGLIFDLERRLLNEA